MNFYPEYSFVIFSAAAVLAAVISFLFYKKAKISVQAKLSLVILRAVNITLVLALIFISFLTYISEKEEKPVNIFLADISGSTSLENRKEEINKAFELLKTASNNISDNKFYYFSNGIISESSGFVYDSLKTGSVTNLTKTIEDILKANGNKKISSVNIVSDGIINAGGNPYNAILQAGVRFNYFLAGDTVQKKDLCIKNAFFNKTTFTGSTNKIILEFFSFDTEKEIRINLSENDNPVQNKLVRVSKDKSLYSVFFEIESVSEGIKKYKIEIENEPGEITYKNNSEEFFINYLSNKFNLLVISGNPSPDYSYLKEAIYGSENFKADFFTQKSAGVFYEGQVPPLSGYDILLLINYPNSSSDLALPEKLNSELEKTGMPVFFIAGSNTDFEKLKIISDHLPVNIAGTGLSEEKSALKFINGFNERINGISELEKSAVNAGEVYTPGIIFSPKPGAEVILLSAKTSKPVLLINKTEKKYSAALLCYNFFKWRLNNSETDKKNLAGIILKNVITSICDKEKSKKIVINTNEQVYFPDESVKVEGHINSLNLTGSESVKLQIYNNNFTKEPVITKSSANNFSSELKNIPEGEYSIKGILYENGIETGNDIKKILIKESNSEYKETKSNDNLLRSISDATGGIRFTNESLKDVGEKIYEKNKTDIKGSEVRNKLYLNSLFPFLLLIILLFSTEWFIRKRLNLP